MDRLVRIVRSHQPTAGGSRGNPIPCTTAIAWRRTAFQHQPACQTGSRPLDLHRYERLKSDLADLLRAVPWRPDQFERNRDLFARLAEDRFNLAVVGRFSRGKSTLMNAMLGLDRLPTGIEPLTSVVTSVCYGSTEKVVLHFRDTTLFQDIRLAELEHYVTERGNPGNRRRIREAEIQLPADLLRSGFRFIDTPGLGSPVAGNTAETRRFLPEADAFLLVTGFDGPLTADEADVLVAAAADRRRLFIVLNKSDLLDQEGRDAWVGSLRRRLGELGLDRDQTIYPVSATAALDGRLGRMPEAALNGSGFVDLERDVFAFLIRGKREAFLHGMCARLEAVVSGIPAPGPALDRLVALRKEIDTDAEQPLESRSVDDNAIPADLLDCPICRHVAQAAFDTLTGLQGDLRADPAARRTLAQRGGLCGTHARQFLAHVAPREVCIGMAPVLDARAALLRAMAEGTAADLLLPSDCPVCSRTLEVEDAMLTSMAADGSAASDAAFYLPHLGRLLRRTQGHHAVPGLLQRQASILERRAADMRRFALKQDAGLRDRFSDEEHRAAATGMAVLVGPDGQ